MFYRCGPVRCQSKYVCGCKIGSNAIRCFRNYGSKKRTGFCFRFAFCSFVLLRPFEILLIAIPAVDIPAQTHRVGGIDRSVAVDIARDRLCCRRHRDGSAGCRLGFGRCGTGLGRIRLRCCYSRLGRIRLRRCCYSRCSRIRLRGCYNRRGRIRLRRCCYNRRSRIRLRRCCYSRLGRIRLRRCDYRRRLPRDRELYRHGRAVHAGLYRFGKCRSKGLSDHIQQAGFC